MNVRHLERVLVNLDAPASFLDTVTRVLRAESRLPIGGRGPNAPQIGPAEASWVLLALAGTDVAAQAGHALHRLLELRYRGDSEPRHADSLADALQVIVGDLDKAEAVWEIRVGRSHAHSQIVYRDGHVEHFVLPKVAPDKAAEVGVKAFRSEGVLGGDLIFEVAKELFLDGDD